MSGEQRGQELIVGCLTASAAIAAGSALADGDGPGFRLVAGLAFTAVGLATVNMWNPDLAGGFAVLVLTTTLFVYGEPFLKAVESITGEPGKKGRKSGVPSDPNLTGTVNA